MSKTREPINPFYALVVLVGAAFVVTTLAYATMAYRASAPIAAQADAASVLMGMVDRYGVQTMGIELGLLSAATFGAMWLDRLRARNAHESGETADWKESRS